MHSRLRAFPTLALAVLLFHTRGSAALTLDPGAHIGAAEAAANLEPDADRRPHRRRAFGGRPGSGELIAGRDPDGFSAGRVLSLEEDANYAFSFFLLDDYPAFAGVTGIGWLVRSGEPVDEAQRHPEWLFAFRRPVEPAIPEPGAALLFACGILVWAARRRPAPAP